MSEVGEIEEEIEHLTDMRSTTKIEANCIEKTRQCSDYSAKPTPQIEIEAFHAENLR